MQYEKFAVETWVENVYRLFTDRNFAIRGADGRTLGYARSVWAMISMNTRRPADLLALHGGSIVDYICPEQPCPIAKPGRIKVTASAPQGEFTARYSDIDINGHFNSIRYIEHILDLFPLVSAGMPVIVLPSPADQAVNRREGVDIPYFPTADSASLAEEQKAQRILDEKQAEAMMKKREEAAKRRAEQAAKAAKAAEADSTAAAPAETPAEETPAKTEAPAPAAPEVPDSLRH